jgi:hypothetical protein
MIDTDSTGTVCTAIGPRTRISREGSSFPSRRLSGLGLVAAGVLVVIAGA